MTLYGLRSTRGCETGDYRVTQQIVFRGALARPRDRFKDSFCWIQGRMNGETPIRVAGRNSVVLLNGELFPLRTSRLMERLDQMGVDLRSGKRGWYILYSATLGLFRHQTTNLASYLKPRSKGRKPDRFCVPWMENRT